MAVNVPKKNDGMALEMPTIIVEVQAFFCKRIIPLKNEFDEEHSIKNGAFFWLF